MMMVTTGMVFASNSIDQGSKFVLFKDFKVEEDVMLVGNIIGIFSDVEIDGTVNGDVVSIFGSVKTKGIIDGILVSILGRVDLGDNAIINQDKVQIFSSSAISSNAFVRGNIIDVMSFESQLSGITILLIVIMIVFIIKNIIDFVLSLILLLGVPKRINKITDAATQRIGRRFGIGILVVLFFYVSSIVLGLLGFFIIGIPFLLVLLILKWLINIGGKTAIKLAIGRKLCKKEGCSQITQLILGSLIYLLIEITIIGAFVLYLGKLVGIGAVIDTKIGSADNIDINNRKSTETSAKYTVVNEENKLTEESSNIQDTKENTDDTIDNDKRY